MSPENTKALATLDKNYPIDRYNRLFQSQNIMNAALAPFQRISFEIIQVDISKGSDAIYKTGTKKTDRGYVDLFGLGGTVLNQISMGLSIQWDADKSGRTDDGINNRIARFKAVGALKKPDGTIVQLVGTKEIDLDAIEDETRFNLEEKARAGKLKLQYARTNDPPLHIDSEQCKEEIDRRVRVKMIGVAKHKHALSESGARNRAIRSTGLKTSYTLEELKKPFVISRIDSDPNQITDPELRRQMALKAMGAQNDLYPQAEPTHAESSQSISDPELNPDDEITPSVEIQEDEPTKEEVARNDYKISLEGMSNEDRFVQMESLAKRKKVVGADGTSQWLPGKNWTSKPEQEQVNEIMAVYDRDEPLPAN